MPQSKNKKPDFFNAAMTVYEVKDERPSLPLPRPINPVLPEIPGIVVFDEVQEWQIQHDCQPAQP